MKGISLTDPFIIICQWLNPFRRSRAMRNNTWPMKNTLIMGLAPLGKPLVPCSLVLLCMDHNYHSHCSCYPEQMQVCDALHRVNFFHSYCSLYGTSINSLLELSLIPQLVSSIYKSQIDYWILVQGRMMLYPPEAWIHKAFEVALNMLVTWVA